MFDEFTSSNAESEHRSLKKASLGMVATQKVTTLFQKSDMSAENKFLLRQNYQSRNLDMICVDTKCQLSKLFVKPCFEALCRNCDLASKCVSKQTSAKEWIVIYRRKWTYNTDHYLHFLPMIQHKRYVKLNEGKVL